MFIVVTLIAIFVLISIYLFFRAENLQSQLTKAKRDSKKIQKDNKNLFDSILMSANKNEEFAKFRLQEIKSQLDEKLTEELKEELEILTILTSNYSVIFKECLKGTPFKAITESCFEAYAKGSFSNLANFISNQEAPLRRIWTNSNLQSLVSLTEALLLQLDQKAKQ